MTTIIKSLLIFVALLAFLPAGHSSPQTASQTMTIVSEWNLALNEMVLEINYGTVDARHIQALMHTAMYNAWTAYDSKAVSAYGVKDIPKQPPSQRTQANKEKAVSYAAYYTLRALLPTVIGTFNQIMRRHGYSTSIINPNPNSAAGIGIIAAERVIRARWNDNSNWRGNLNPSGVPYAEPILLKGYKPYRYTNTADKLRDINHWQPLRNPDGTPQVYVGAHQGIVTPFALKSGSQFRPHTPPNKTYTDYEEFVAQAQQIYDISQALTTKQILIAEYWQGTGRFESNFHAWFNITRDVSMRNKNSLDDDVKMFFLVGNALMDSMISCYDSKRHFDYVRPITVIRELIDPNWDTLFLTPPFPEFTAGHPATSAAAGEVLRLFLGSDCYGASYTDPETGITLYWETFTKMWKEIGVSRMFGGIHFEDGVRRGEIQGLKVAQVVFEKYQRLVEGACDE